MSQTHSTQPPRIVPLARREAYNLEQFTSQLGRCPLWHILPQGETDASKASGLFAPETRIIAPPAHTLAAFLQAHSFVLLCSRGKNVALALLQTGTGLLWSNEASDNQYCLTGGKEVLEKVRWAGLSGWRLPSCEELQSFAMAPGNPFRQGKEYRLRTLKGGETNGWLCDEGRTDTDRISWYISDEFARIFACHTLWANATPVRILGDLLRHGWDLLAAGGGDCFRPTTDLRWQNLEPAELLVALQREKSVLLGADTDNPPPQKAAPLQLDPTQEYLVRRLREVAAIKAAAPRLDPADFLLPEQLANLDHRSCRLPRLDSARLRDPEQGLWELWGEDPQLLRRYDLQARDPRRDVQQRAVAIDFGTSSTVVACETPSGGRELLRIGVRDFYQPVQPQHFENPTVLECLDYAAFARTWQAEAYRPALDWDWMRAAHEAQVSFRDNPGDTRILASILPRLKQWALRDAEHRRVRLTDRKGLELELPQHQERNPVRGQPLQVGTDDPFDPVELYAWYLGMAINWRGHGLFLNYYLSFPVKYPAEVRERILASFRRGLQRSLPPTLISHHADVLNEFTVKALASEPAAYAAAALQHFGIAPGEQGTPYAVFDFGGGTTDFDFGLLRWANSDEEESGYEQVFEHLASSGDNFLGGENLIEHMAYHSFVQNLDELRRHHIQFTRPMDASPFSGSEAFLAYTQAAQTNTVMLCARLRPFLEGSQASLSEQIKLDLIDIHGQKQTCELALDARALDDLLLMKMEDGVRAFLSEMARIRSEFPPTPIHVFLAGNGSHSRHIQALFDTAGENWQSLLQTYFGNEPPELTIHPPLPQDEANPHAPTAKTGVALGLLRLAPGENVLLVNHLHQRNDGQAPFAWFVGRMHRGKFEPVLAPGATYGHWYDIGPLQSGVFNLYTTLSPRAHSGLMDGNSELKKHRLDFLAAPLKSRLYVRASGPHIIDIVAAPAPPAEGENIDIRNMLLG